MTTVVTTSLSGMTMWCSTQAWRGHTVVVQSHDDKPCAPDHHMLDVMHHFGEDGKHYCPTGFLWCPLCCGVAREPEPFECHLWGESSDPEPSE